MGSKASVQPYGVRSSNSFFVSSLHDLNAVDSLSPDGIGRVEENADRAAEAGEELHDTNDPDSVDSLEESFENSLTSQSVGIKEGSCRIENSGSSSCSYEMLSIEDVSPIESARARFLQMIVEHFICDHVVEVPNKETLFESHSGTNTYNKRKSSDAQYEGDPSFALPLMYIANMYESLVNEANPRLSSLSGSREKTIGVALEAAGGLYRTISKKYPKKGSCIFRRRELATSLETRTRFPELVIQEEKRVRFVVVNGLDIVEKPTSMTSEDAAWFKRLTGRTDVSISPSDYKYYSPRHKYRRVGSSVSTSPLQNPNLTPPKLHIKPFLNQPLIHLMHQSHRSPLLQNPASSRITPGGSPLQLPDLTHSGHSSTISDNMDYMQPIGGRLHVLPSGPAKFCDECGAPYMRESSKFCSECGAKRLGR